MDEQELALKALIRQRHMSYEAFCREWDRVAGNTDEALKGRYPGRAQYYRWLRGDLANKRPYPDACRMLEAMFPGWPVEKLFSEYIEEIPVPADLLGFADTSTIDEEQRKDMERRRLLQGLAALGVTISPLSQEALRMPSSELAGMPSHTIDLSGEWWASWQTFRDGVEKIASQQVECKQSGELIQVTTITHGLAVEEGGYHWSGELRLWDNEILMGWYTASEGSVRSKGTMYFSLHPHGLKMTGRWVGLGYDDRIMTGWGSMAKTREAAETVIDRLNREHGGINI
jgi:hypothetical protein